VSLPILDARVARGQEKLSLNKVYLAIAHLFR